MSGKHPSDPYDRAMAHALRLAARGRGWTSPNPMVGAVLLRDGHILGEGYHAAVGCPHAEREALADAERRGHDVRGATMVVNLEPCNHHGRTPPCTDAILAAGLSRVVVAHQDPNPLVDGSGLKRLYSEGVEVVVGPQADEAIALNEIYCRYICSQRPFIALKAAVTLDGRIATEAGDSQWVSGPASLRFAHWLRQKYDAILIGANTAMRDNPQLTCRLGANRRVRHPLRVVVDSRLRIAETSRLVDASLPGETLIATTEAADPAKIDRLAKPGVKVKRFPPDQTGRVELAALFMYLHTEQVAGVLVEGGGHVHASLLRNHWADKLYLVQAPKIVGGSRAPSWVADSLADKMSQARLLRDMKTRPLGADLLLEGYFEETGECLRV